MCIRDRVALACKISELTYGTAYLSKIRTQAAVDGRAYIISVSYTHLRAHETVLDLVCRLLLEKQNQ